MRMGAIVGNTEILGSREIYKETCKFYFVSNGKITQPKTDIYDRFSTEMNEFLYYCRLSLAALDEICVDPVPTEISKSDRKSVEIPYGFAYLLCLNSIRFYLK
jgi:hypothetical protein